jgi:signal peptidase I
MPLYTNALLLIIYCCLLTLVDSLSTPTKATSSLKAPPSTFPKTFSFSVSLINARPKPESFVDSFIELWNDPRPVTSLLNVVGERETAAGEIEEIPYCIISAKFQIDTELFQILLYPRGRVVSGSTANDGPASAYLRYLPKKYGDEVDIAWNLQLGILHDDKNFKVFPVSTSGGLPKSNTTWSAAMTFCSDNEAVESVGRATDWGSSSWSSQDVCNGLGNIMAQGSVTVFERRTGESSFAWPPLSKGAIGAVTRASMQDSPRDFRVGEVIVPRQLPAALETTTKALQDQFVYPGIDYRIMTMADKDGNPIFSTESLKDKRQARLAIRPCGWKFQQQSWKRKGMTTEWPVEVKAGLLSNVTSTRFNLDSALPRVIAAFQRDWISYTLALAIAVSPIPLALFARTFVSFYAIPSASMEPTLLKGDVLLVEKLPRVYDRTNRGDVILFQPPSALRDIVMQSGSRLPSTSLFVKRIVGLPGDENIRLVGDNDVTINGEPAVGPDRALCRDEPLRLIDKLLETGKGKDIDRLGEDDVYVLGDCKAVSVDSRVFGVLEKGDIVGKPVARLWPLDRIQLSNKF